jgi:hypothetical protein
VYTYTCEVMGVCGAMKKPGVVEAFLAFLGIVISFDTKSGYVILATIKQEYTLYRLRAFSHAWKEIAFVVGHE